MPISYRVYANDGRGGDVNYTSPIATTAGLSLALGPLASPSDSTYAVRAFDVTSGIEEANTDARVRVVVDGAGNDISARPNPVNGLSARRTAGGSCRISWNYDEAGQGGPPSFFSVALGPGPAESVAYVPGAGGHSCSVPGPDIPGLHPIEVRAVGSSSFLVSEPAVITIEYRETPLNAVDDLVAVPTP